MVWDQAILRKFSTTGHFRLLNQVRSELRAQPLERDQKTRVLHLQARPIKQSVSPRTVQRIFIVDSAAEPSSNENIGIDSL